MKQKIFNYKVEPKYNIENFFVSTSNKQAFEYITNKENILKNSIIKGPKKSGKTHLGLIWKNINNAIIYDQNNYKEVLVNKYNILIDDFLTNLNEESLFHIINHCINYKKNILLLTDKSLNDYNFKLIDLLSRLKSFNYIEINNPDDDLLINLFMKLLSDKQIIINNNEIFSYILKRIRRTYLDIYLLVEKIDKFSLEKKRELTIPLIKELL